MQTFATRADRWSLALIIPALAALAACSDEPVAPKRVSVPEAEAAGRANATEPIELYVTNTSGGTEVGSLRWAAEQMKWSGGGIQFDPSLGGQTIVLDAGLQFHAQVEIYGPPKGVTISGKDQFRIIEGTTLFLQNLTITKGYADYAAAVKAAWLEMYHTTISGNRSPESAVYAWQLALWNSTVSGNTVGRAAVEWGTGSLVSIGNSTIAYNAPGAGIGPNGKPSSSMHVYLVNSIISNNGSPQQNCTSFYGLEYQGTVISNDWSCGEVGITVADPMLFPLQNNGGPSMTHAISHLGPAYNASPVGIFCGDYDQRYVPRDAKCDVGAFEFNDWTKVTITIDPTVKADAATGQPVLTGTLKCTRPEFFHLALELHQDQKVGKQVVDVHSADNVPLECTPSGSRWSAHMPLAPGEAFQAGAARATATTYQTPDWVTPASVASAVKISFARK